jgi:hypothetical protein
MQITKQSIYRRAASFLSLLAVLAAMQGAAPECFAGTAVSHCANMGMAAVHPSSHKHSMTHSMACCHHKTALDCVAGSRCCAASEQSARHEELQTIQLKQLGQQETAAEIVATTSLFSAPVEVAESPPSKAVFDLKTDLRI